MQNIKLYLLRERISLRELARRADLDPGHLCRILHGKARITDRTARRLARAMRLKEWWRLVTTEGKEKT